MNLKTNSGLPYTYSFSDIEKVCNTKFTVHFKYKECPFNFKVFDLGNNLV